MDRGRVQAAIDAPRPCGLRSAGVPPSYQRRNEQQRCASRRRRSNRGMVGLTADHVNVEKLG